MPLKRPWAQRIGRNILAWIIKGERRRRDSFSQKQMLLLRKSRENSEAAERLRISAANARDEVGGLALRNELLEAFGKAFHAEHAPKAAAALDRKAKRQRKLSKRWARRWKESKSTIKSWRKIAKERE